MAADQYQGLRIITENPAPTATLDVQVSIVDSTGTKNWTIDGSNRGEVALFASGTALTVNGSNLNVNLAQQSATALAVSATAAANTAGNPLFIAESVGGTVVSATHGSYDNILQGNAVLSATNGIFTNILQGNTALSQTLGLPVQITDGTNFLGTTGNPLVVSVTSAGEIPTNEVYPYYKSTAIAAGASSAVIDVYTPSAAFDGYLKRLWLAAPGYGHFDVTNDATLIATVYVSPSHPQQVLEWGDDNPVIIANATNLKVQFTNDGAKDSIVWTAYTTGYES